MKTNYIFAFVVSVLLSLATSTASAQECTNQYGARVDCTPTDLIIDKQVQKPGTTVFVENLTATDPAFAPGAIIVYHLTIKNGSGETMHPVTVKDIFPERIEFDAGPGTYNKDDRTLTFILENMIAGESRTVEIFAKVANVTNVGLSCAEKELNIARVSSPARPNGDEDRSQVCIQTDVLGAVHVLPVAGFEDWIFAVPFVITGIGGLSLLKKRTV